MYLTIKQHDKFRTLLMGFEIPFRTYIARTIINKYPNEIDFENALCAKNKLIGPTSPEVIKNNLPKLCKHNSCIKTYNILKISNNSTDAIVPEDLDVPFVSTLNVVSCSLTEDFSGLYSLFSSYNAYCECAEMYRFARNHLDHPGSRTLEEQHLIPVLSFESL